MWGPCTGGILPAVSVDAATRAGHFQERWPWLRPLLVRTLINAVALVLAIVVFSLLSAVAFRVDLFSEFEGAIVEFSNGEILDIVLFGLALAVLSAFVRPVLTALTGSLVFRTYGLIVVAIDVLIFWLAIEVVAAILDVPVELPDPRLVWLLGIALGFSVLLLALETLLGLNRPRLADATEDQPLWRLLDRLPLAGRSRFVENLRLSQVRQIVVQYGLDISLSGTALGRFRGVADRLLGRDPDEFQALSTPAKVRLMLQQLGPTYVKVGQMVSSRADVLPEAWRTELDKLQNTVPPFPYDQVSAIVTSELGAAPDVLFGSIEHEPLGAASLAQVHRATLHDGSAVVLKVQRPNVQAMVRADLGNMEDLARQAERRIQLARTMNLAAMIHEFGVGVLTELDYRIEAYHALRLAEVVAGVEGVHVPRVYLDLSAGRVITMEYIQGVKATDLAALDAAGVDRDLVARRLVRAMIKQVLVDGFFHGDPHPGNIVIDPATGALTFLDLGLVGELDSARRLQLMGLMWSLKQRDPEGMATGILGLCTHQGSVDEAAFRSDMRRLFYQYWIYGTGDFSRLMTAVFGVLARRGLRLDEALTLAVKALVQAEELVRTLSPGIALVDVGYEEARQVLGAEMTMERLLGMATSELTSTAMEIGKRLPSLRQATLGWLDQYQRGRFVVTVETSDLQKGLTSVGSVSRNLTIGLIVAGQLIAVALLLAVLLLSDSGTPEFVTLGVLVFAGVLAFSLVMLRRVSKTP
jgi:ubiquinone biosynthesis protein